jgi:hypothetical protein
MVAFSECEDHSNRAAQLRVAAGVFWGWLISRLDEGGYGPEDGDVGMLEVLVHVGLTAPKGVVLDRRAHSEFMKQSGLLRDMLVPARQGVDTSRLAPELRLAYRRSPVGEPNRAMSV